MRAARGTLLLIGLWLSVGGSVQATEPVRGEVAPIEESNRSSILRKAYSPFLAIGHGIFFIVEYGVGYPLYYLAKPVIDFAYSSPDDPAGFPNSRR